MASAQEMMPWCRANLILPMQRIISFIVERQVYRPYIEDNGFSVKLTPYLKWEAPDAHKDEEAEYWALQVQSGIVPAEYAAQEQGFDIDKIKKYRDEEAKRQQEQIQQQDDKDKFPIKPKQSIKQKTIEEIIVERAIPPEERKRLKLKEKHPSLVNDDETC